MKTYRLTIDVPVPDGFEPPKYFNDWIVIAFGLDPDIEMHATPTILVHVEERK